MMRLTSLKRILAFTLALVVICVGFSAVAVWQGKTKSLSASFAQEAETVLTLQIGNPKMTVNGTQTKIDDDGTTPVIVGERTLVPIRAIIEALGGNVKWDDETKTVFLTMNEKVVTLVIGSEKAFVNEEEKTLDVAPAIINNRTMLPIRFISESFGFEVAWDDETKTVSISSSAFTDENNSHSTDEAAAPEVFMTTEITPEALVEIYDKLGFSAEGNVAVKMSTGEPPNSNYLRPELIKDLVQKVNGTIVECNTAYGGSRSTTAMHKQVIEDHGFNAIAKTDIMDEDGSLEIPIANGTRITSDYVGAHLANYDSLISLAHFKGHGMAGYGGAIKNMSIGIGSAQGKRWIHSGGTSTESMWGGEQDAFLEAMADATSGVVDYMEGKVVYINVMNRLSIDCDCDGNPSEPDMHDIGILASTDPVALDQACLDLVYAQKDGDGKSLVERIESRNGLHTLEQAEKIGLGSRQYKLVSIDD